MTFQSLLKQSINEFRPKKIQPELIIQLICFCFNINKSTFILNLNQDIPESYNLTSYYKYLNEFISGKPIEYITGKTYFNGNEYKIRENVFIPRHETELIITKIRDLIDLDDSILNYPVFELGSGSGIISIELSKLGFKSIYSFDKNVDAINLSIENSTFHKATNIEFIHDDFFSSFHEKYTHSNHKKVLIVSNPPYIGTNEINLMDKKVIEHEPHNALFADNDGFECIHKLVSLFRSLSGYLIFEFGFQQQPQINSMTKKLLLETHFYKDYNNHFRVAIVKSN